MPGPFSCHDRKTKNAGSVLQRAGSLKIERRQREGSSPVWIIWTPAQLAPSLALIRRPSARSRRRLSGPPALPQGRSARVPQRYVRQKKTVTAEPLVTEKGITTQLDIEPEIGPTKMIP